MMKPRPSWRGSVAIIPGVVVGALPACPLCWPVYAGAMSSVGLGFLLKTTYLLPLTAISLLVALAGLGYRSETRRGYGPLLAGVLGAGILLVGKFSFDSDPSMYLGVATLITAAVWNAWPRRGSDQQGATCDCAEAGQLAPITESERTRSET